MQMLGLYIHPSVWKHVAIIGGAGILVGVVTVIIGAPIWISWPLSLVAGFYLGKSRLL